MKKLLLSIFAIGVVASAIAQGPTEVLINKAYTYRVSATPIATSYKWSLSGGTTAAGITAVNAATIDNVSITWDNAVVGSNYNLIVAGILSGCEGDDFTKTYTVVNQLSYTAAWVQGYNTCPSTVKNPAGGTDAAFDLQITVNVGAALTAADQIRVSYMINNVPQPAATVSQTAGLAKVPVTFTDATNTTGAAIVKNIIVTGIAIVGRTPVSFPDSDRPVGSVNILPVPVINDIF
jgi:hypothetical protein